MSFMDDIEEFIARIIEITDNNKFASNTALKAIKDECIWTRQVLRKKYEDGK